MYKRDRVLWQSVILPIPTHQRKKQAKLKMYDAKLTFHLVVSVLGSSILRTCSGPVRQTGSCGDCVRRMVQHSEGPFLR